ncbi:hypothetical protein NFI96_027265 [Prochilodus magdalenae]|nr:hypothetical protein NFI96_027265 [Prochilodus magdalenae]
MAMDQARSTITKIFNGEPRSYTRFNLTQNMEGDNSQVEMKLSTDADEEVGGNGVGEHMNHHPRPSYTSKASQRSPRSICFMGMAVLLLFIIGYLVGYLAHRKADKESPSCAEAIRTDDGEAMVPIETVPSLDWSDITNLLKSKLTTSSIETSLSEFSSQSHQAGSPGDEVLANKLMRRFKDYGMNPWTDEHFIRVQDPPTSGFNKVTFKDQEFTESGFLSYSATGTAQGAVLYAYYGQLDDLRRLQDLSIDLSGRVLLVRAGKISSSEKVANAARMNASAVLIYPDPADFSVQSTTDLFDHVHLGCGDPYTPAFPSFNHTQFPPATSSGLPSIPAQTIKASTAAAIMSTMGGRDPPRGWGDGGLRDVSYKLGSDSDLISVDVNNVLTEKKIHNVFGVIKGYVDADRYVVIGAQRDAWGPGYARSTIGTTLLAELARTISEMIRNNGFRPRRSIVFASWSAGEYGAVGATEWLEGYMSSLNMKAFSYISLDGVVTGTSFKASASPLMYDLIQSTLKEVSSPIDYSKTLFSQVAGSNWESAVMEPMKMSDPAYPFQAFSGIPSVSFRFTSDKQYPFFGTLLDNRKNLETKASYSLPSLTMTAGVFAGQMALRLVHDHLLRLNVDTYTNIIRRNVALLNREVLSLQSSGRVPKTLKMEWLMSALGSYSRASKKINSNIQDSDLEDVEQCRIINNRIMGVERNLLSPYVSPRESPFRHILLGSGSHTLDAVFEHLALIKEGLAGADIDLLRNQFALTTWTIQSCANALAGNVLHPLQNMEDNSSQVELVLSGDLTEEGEVTHHFHQSSSSKPSQRSPRNICCMLTASVIVFAFGFLIGYLAHPKTDSTSAFYAESSDDDGDDGPVRTDVSLDWRNLTAFLKATLTTSSIEDSLSQFSNDSHEAGSLGDEKLGEEVLERFKNYDMKPWTDEHFVNIQEGPARGQNRVTFGGAVFEEPGYLAYSATGLVKGPVLYAYYGLADDFRQLADLQITPSGRIVLVRAGKISFAEKVANAASVNASAVLIYPDPADYSFDEGAALFGHVHLGCGDPYTPGFPSFSYTQLPPATSSGLPAIPAQTIRASTAAAIMRKMKGLDPPPGWGNGSLPDVTYKLGGDNDTASVEVNNVLTVKKIRNVFGVIKGFQDPDHYVVIGAQRDAWGPGYARSTVGTSLLVELARTFSNMISKNGFKPRRSIVFASWSGGEYGAVGATEWLESCFIRGHRTLPTGRCPPDAAHRTLPTGRCPQDAAHRTRPTGRCPQEALGWIVLGYLSSLSMKAFSYISLDGVVTGSSFKASASPLMHDLIQSTLKEVSSPTDASRSLYSEVAGSSWETAVMEPMRMSDSAYPFQASSGVPSVSFRFTSGKEYPFFGTLLDTKENLQRQTSMNLLVLTKTAGEIAGQMALRLVHDHLLRLNVETYSSILQAKVAQINKEVVSLQSSARLPKTPEMQWLLSAMGSYGRAASTLTASRQNSNLEDSTQCRIINNRIMGVERDFLSPYVSPRESPFRHILLGSGSHTLEALRAHLAAIKEGSARADPDMLRNRFALATWTIQTCANALAGNLWDVDNDI